MIIVSQDQTKITQRLEFYIQRNSGTDEELQYEIRSIGGGSFGGYETEERAKEVLQKLIQSYREYRTAEVDGYTNVLEETAVYEMPLE